MMPLPTVFSSSMKAIITNWSPDKLEAFEERIAIVQYGCDIPGVRAEEIAFNQMATIKERAEFVKMEHAQRLMWQKRNQPKMEVNDD